MSQVLESAGRTRLPFPFHFVLYQYSFPFLLKNLLLNVEIFPISL